MKNYSPKVAAQLAVFRNVQHGISRHGEKELARTTVASVLTEKAHVSALTLVASSLYARDGKHLKNLNKEEAQAYLIGLATTRRQSTVSLARQAINLHLLKDDPLPFVPSEVPTEPADRAYTCAEIDLLIEYARPELAFSIALSADAGLRGMELLTLASPGQLQPSVRDWLPDRFRGREYDAPFIVWGKGGLHREVRVSEALAVQLEGVRRETKVKVSHRGAHLPSFFQLLGGHRFSKEFGRLSMKGLGFSHGAHGLRHSFAQRRRNELLCCGLSLSHALAVVSQEIGHFHDKNTRAYMRDCVL